MTEPTDVSRCTPSSMIVLKNSQQRQKLAPLYWKVCFPVSHKSLITGEVGRAIYMGDKSIQLIQPFNSFVPFTFFQHFPILITEWEISVGPEETKTASLMTDLVQQRRVGYQQGTGQIERGKCKPKKGKINAHLETLLSYQ